MERTKCKKCFEKKFWKVRRGKLRCKNCGYEFVPRLGGISLTNYQWKALLKWFLRCQSINTVVEETGISEYKVLKALKLIREVMASDIPDIFDGVVEVDETYLGGSWKNKRKKIKRTEKPSKRGRGTSKQPVFGILARNGKVWATIVPDTEAKNLIPIIEKKVKRGTRVNSDTWRAYTGLATKGYVYRTVEHAKQKYTKGKNHIKDWKGSLVT
jgi:transposase